MKKLLVHMWNRVERAITLETDSLSQKRQKITLMILAILCCITGFLSIINTLIVNESRIVLLPPITFNLITGSGIVLYLLTKRYPVLLYTFLCSIFFVPVMFQITIGGFSGQGSVPVILWSLLAPFGALMFQSIKSATRWFYAFLIFVLSMLIFDHYFIRFSEKSIEFSEMSITHPGFMISYGLTILVLSIIIFVSMRYFVNAFHNEKTKVDNLVLELTDTNHELESTLLKLKTAQTELIHSEKMASLGQLAAGIAHEINNPIGVIKSNLDLNSSCIQKIEQELENTGLVSQKNDTLKYLNILKTNTVTSNTGCQRIITLVKSFKNFARLDEAEFQTTDIHEGIDSSLALLQHKMKDKINVIKDYSSLPRIQCYPGMLNQVFMTILYHAIKSISDKGTISIYTYIDEENINISISDTGKAIPPETLTTLFELGLSEKESRIGMSIDMVNAYNIIKKHQGGITVDSKSGKGTEFKITLPINSKI